MTTQDMFFDILGQRSYHWQTISTGDGFSEKLYGTIVNVEQKLIVKVREHQNIYICPNICSESAVSVGNSRGVVGADFTFTDDDLQSTCSYPYSLYPVMRVVPGRGPHTYWRFKAKDSDDWSTEWTLCQRIAAMICGTDPSLDDIGQVMRVPGFVRYKSHEHPKLVTLEVLNKDAPEYTIDDWENVLSYDSDEWADYKLWWAHVSPLSAKRIPYPMWRSAEWLDIVPGILEARKSSESKQQAIRRDCSSLRVSGRYGSNKRLSEVAVEGKFVKISCPFGSHTKTLQDASLSCSGRTYWIRCFHASCDTTWELHDPILWSKSGQNPPNHL